MSYLRNCWYAAAWSGELDQGPVGRKIIERPVVVFRSESGELAALEDRCPHRFARLSMGKVRGDSIECPYHGLRFDAQGSCVRSPFSEVIPAGAQVGSFPVAERHGLIWVWMGEAALADPALIADLSVLEDREHWRPASGYMHVGVNYEIMIDNLLDLSHAEFIHAGNLGPGDLARGTFEARYNEDAVEYSISVLDTTPPPFTNFLNDSEGRQVDFRVIGRWDAPGIVWLESRTRFTDDRALHVRFRGVHVVTPETERSSHYFYSGLRDCRLDDEDLQAMLEVGLETAFAEEDKPMVEAAQANMASLDLFAENPLILPMDGAAVRVRRRLQRLIEKERAGHAAVPSVAQSRAPASA